MKKLFLLFAVASFLLFSCASVQEKPSTENAEEADAVSTDASPQDSSFIEEKVAAAVDAMQADTAEEYEAVAADAQPESGSMGADEEPEIALAGIAESAQEAIPESASQGNAEEDASVQVIAAEEAAPSDALSAGPKTQRRSPAQRPPRQAPPRNRQDRSAPCHRRQASLIAEEPDPAGRAPAQPPADISEERAEESALASRPLAPPPVDTAEELSDVALSAEAAEIAADAETSREEELPNVSQAPSEVPPPEPPAPEQTARSRRNTSRTAGRAESRSTLPAPSAAEARPTGAQAPAVALEELIPHVPGAEAEGLAPDSEALLAGPLPAPSAAEARPAGAQAPAVALEELIPPAAGAEAEGLAPDSEALFADPLPAPSATEAISEVASIEEEEEIAALEEEPLPEPSRTVFLSAGQSLEVWYPGGGWSFEGFRETAPLSGMTFNARRFEDGDTLFFFRSSSPGSFILEFSRFDIPTGRYIADSLAVEVSPSGALPSGAEQALVRPGVVRAPDYEGLGTVAARHSASALPAPSVIEEDSAVAMTAAERETEDDSLAAAPAERALNAAPAPAVAEERLDDDLANEPSVTVATNARAVAEDAPSLSDIRAMIDAGDIEVALPALDRFFAENAGDTDEALFLQGQAFEANSPRRDMRRALSAYETLTQNYPLSRFWQDADRRIRYIRRFYFDMR